MSCPHCQESARFVEYRPKNIVSLVGTMRLSRPYYHCAHCGQGHLPWDLLLRLTSLRLTPGAEEVVSLAGVQESFGKAADRTLYKMAGLELCESTVERTTESAGERLGKLLDQAVTFGAKSVWKWNPDARGKTCAYVSVDATGIMMQGPNGSKVEGRMVNVGMIYNPQPRDAKEEAVSKPCDSVRYLAGLCPLADLGLPLRWQGAHVGMDEADQWIALSDGGNGLEDFLIMNFPRAETILDFRHASEHLSDFAKVFAASDKVEKLLDRWCHTMKHRGGTAVLKILAALDANGMTAEVRKDYERLLGYLRNNEHRMDYPKYLRNGWQIATGSMESACKTVVNQRLCMGGMRWGEEGSDAVCHLRALYRSDPDQWDGYWECVSKT